MFSLFKKEDGNSIHINEIDRILEDINLIDIREPYECTTGRIKRSKNVPMALLLSTPERYLTKLQKYYIISQSGVRSLRTASELMKAGYDVVNVRGGMTGYTGKNRATL